MMSAINPSFDGRPPTEGTWFHRGEPECNAIDEESFVYDHVDRLRARPSLSYRLRVAYVAVALSVAPATLASAAPEPPVSVELNKLEPQGGACRAYLVVDNLSDTAYQALRLDTYLFRTDGVIDRRLLVDLAPMQATKKSVRPFVLDGIACEAIGSFLVNGVTECRDASGPVADCLSRLRFTSRASATLSK